MKWEQVPLGPLQTNCYIVYQENDCLIIDPGEEGKKLINLLEKRKVKPQAILLTHAHFDHIGAVDTVRDHYQIPVYIHRKEEKWLLDPSLNGSKSFMMPIQTTVKAADFFFEKEEKYKLGDFSFEVFETPGHSPGSVSFYFEKAEFVVSGDALFQRSIGRTDLQGGNHEQLIRSIHEKLLVLPEQTLVLPGHGFTTTIREEMDGNPYLNGF